MGGLGTLSSAAIVSSQRITQPQLQTSNATASANSSNSSEASSPK